MSKRASRTREKREILSPSSIFIVPHGGYPFDVMVCIGANDGEVLRALETKGIEPTQDERESLAMDEEACTEGRVVILRGGQTVMRLVNFDGSPRRHGQLAHEVFHAVDLLLYKCGLRHSENSCEAYAYAIEHLTAGILAEIDKAPSKRTRSLLPKGK